MEGRGGVGEVPGRVRRVREGGGVLGDGRVWGVQDGGRGGAEGCLLQGRGGDGVGERQVEGGWGYVGGRGEEEVGEGWGCGGGGWRGGRSFYAGPERDFQVSCLRFSWILLLYYLC